MKKSLKMRGGSVFLISFFFVACIFLLSCTPSIPSVPAEKQCTMDDDCVPAGCCHSADAVNKDFAPDCSETFCTMECAPRTLDCEQGEIKCVDNQCTAVLDNTGEFS